jgi:hypothetical protein
VFQLEEMLEEDYDEGSEGWIVKLYEGHPTLGAASLVGFGRIVVSEIEVRNMLANLV